MNEKDGSHICKECCLNNLANLIGYKVLFYLQIILLSRATEGKCFVHSEIVKAMCKIQAYH